MCVSGTYVYIFVQVILRINELLKYGAKHQSQFCGTLLPAARDAAAPTPSTLSYLPSEVVLQGYSAWTREHLLEHQQKQSVTPCAESANVAATEGDRASAPAVSLTKKRSAASISTSSSPPPSTVESDTPRKSSSGRIIKVKLAEA